MSIRAGVRGWRVGVRNVSYLHVGPRVRGLKRDPAEALKNPFGIHYDSFIQEGHVSEVKKGLNLEKYGIHLPDETVLQCLTHKSFAQGVKPYNQKLSVIGGHFVKYQACLHSMSQPVAQSQLSAASEVNGGDISPEAAGLLINGLNFGMLGKGISKMLISKQSMAEFLLRRDLAKYVFWNQRDAEKSHRFNGEYTVLQTVLNAVVGDVYLLHGSEKAAEYVAGELFNSDANSLTNISEELLSQRQINDKV